MLSPKDHPYGGDQLHKTLLFKHGLPLSRYAESCDLGNNAQDSHVLGFAAVISIPWGP